MSDKLLVIVTCIKESMCYPSTYC